MNHDKKTLIFVVILVAVTASASSLQAGGGIRIGIGIPIGIGIGRRILRPTITNRIRTAIRTRTTILVRCTTFNRAGLCAACAERV